MQKKQKTLFPELENKEEWHAEWQGMPEFICEDQTSFRKIVVHFRNQDDVDAFAELLGQRITPKIPSIWHPELKPRERLKYRYADES